MAGRHNWLPRCGAYARSTGRPCLRKPVLNENGTIRNGRCLNHGGKSTGPKSKDGHDRCTAGRIAYYAARRAAGLQPLPRQTKAPRATVKPPEAKSVAVGPNVVLSPEDIAFGIATGMLKK